ncbi:MAG: ribbon-helix-helix domain-containing protein [Hyphomicrobiaceae bacterium]
MPRPAKHSFTIRGHRTSISLEAEFWDALREIAAERGVSIGALVAEIDAARIDDTGLSTLVRLHILEHYRQQVSRPAATGGDQP